MSTLVMLTHLLYYMILSVHLPLRYISPDANIKKCTSGILRDRQEHKGSTEGDANHPEHL